MQAVAEKTNDAVRKAAVLVRSLDPEAVASLLARMTPSEARAIRQAVRDLDEVTDDDRRGVAQALRAAEGADAGSGVELALGVEPSAAPAVEATRVDNPPAGVNAAQRISDADPESLVACLKLEQPTTIAVVLSCLTPQRAAAVLTELSPELQQAAAERLMNQGEIDPDSLEVIASELEVWIGRRTKAKQRQADRVALLHEILNATPRECQTRLRAALGFKPPRAIEPTGRTEPTIRVQPTEPRGRNHALAEQPASEPTQPAACVADKQPEVIPFTQLADLPAGLIAEVLGSVDGPTMILALAGGSDQLMTRLRGVSSRRQYRALEKQIATIGPVRLRDIQTAQHRVMQEAARVLCAAGVRF